MALALLAILIVLVLGTFTPELAGLRQFLWLRAYVGWLDERIGSQGLWISEFGLAVIVVPLVAATALVDWGLADSLRGLLQFAFALAVLFLCWGPRDLDADIGAVTHATDRDARLAALQDIPTDPPTPAVGLGGVGTDAVAHGGHRVGRRAERSRQGHHANVVVRRRLPGAPGRAAPGHILVQQGLQWLLDGYRYAGCAHGAHQGDVAVKVERVTQPAIGHHEDGFTGQWLAAPDRRMRDGVVPRLPRAGIDLKEHLTVIERDLILQALEETDWVVAHAAKKLCMGRTTLVEKMRKFDLVREGI